MTNNVINNTTSIATTIVASCFWLANKENFDAEKCVSVDPCGPKKFAVYDPLTPSAEFVSWGKNATPEEYKERFIAEILSGLNPNQVAKDLAGKIILSAEGPKFKGNNPRQVITDWLRATGYDCREYGDLTKEEKETFWKQEASDKKEEHSAPQINKEEESAKALTPTATSIDPEIESIIAEIKAKMLKNKKHFGNAVAFQNVDTLEIKRAVLNRLVKTSAAPVCILADEKIKVDAFKKCAEHMSNLSVMIPRIEVDNNGRKHCHQQPQPGSVVIIETRDKISPAILRILAPGCWIIRVVAK